MRLSDLMVCPLKDEEEVLRVGWMMVRWLDGGWMVVGWKVWLVKHLPQKWKLVKSESKTGKDSKKTLFGIFFWDEVVNNIKNIYIYKIHQEVTSICKPRGDDYWTG